ncbi:hypothetical protein [Floridanema aerugineum]|uniref:Uncharacterized protein n=1 Tax=Floridaenema aerugineum BLCC-F46 TaxID=3153654 RepID=A0ABV4XCW8_9CYAN
MLEPLEKQPENSFRPYLQHLGKSPDEQLQKNQAAMKVLKQWLETKFTAEEQEVIDNSWADFQQIVDSARTTGSKVYQKPE